ncbi:MAG: hypothetical protein LAP13_16710 [Acidobacteriia bacterium]|nr:hypothetical protein [Terriglobia bacterium]
MAFGTPASKRKEGTGNSQDVDCARPRAEGSAPYRSRTLIDKVLISLRAAFSFPVMLVAWIALIVVRLAERNVLDLDLWWHLRNAQFLFANHQLPNIDTYSFTVAGRPWMNYEWLGEIPYYLAWRAFGLEGIQILMLLVLESIFFGVLLLCYQRSHHIKASVLACCFAVLLATVNFGPRTILFGYACLVVLLAILERYRSKGRGPLWVLPVLFCVWINTHGSWSLGIIVFVIFIISGLADGQWGNVRANRWSPRQLRWLLLSFGVSCGTLFVNPYGYRLVTYPLDMAFRQHLNIASIIEWQSIDFHSLRGKVVLVLLAGLFCSALATRHQWKLSDLILVLFSFYSGLTYERFLFLAGIIVAPIVAEMLYFVPPYRPEIDKRWLNAAIIVGVLGIVWYWFPRPAQLEKQVAEQFPAEVLPYLESHELSGNMLNFYNWGGYLGWKDPRLKVFVDSRVDIYEYAGVFGDYVRLQNLEEPRCILDKYQIKYILFPRKQPLVQMLKTESNWRVLFTGQISILLERVGPIPSNTEQKCED